MSALLTLSACDTSGEPSPPPTSEDSLTTATATAPAPADDTEVTTEPEPEPTSEEPTEEAAPAMPDEATEFTEDGAEAFVGHYVDTFNYAYATGKPQAMGRLASSECLSCEALLGLLEGESDEDEYLQVHNALSIVTGDGARVETDITQAAAGDTPEQSGTAVFQLTYEEDAWLVDEITIRADA
ncbi:DUF6318 family protein [Ornithinimicrobium sp. W1679]|uniref:DUF6318 family protein n=1 Tax=Ornithinimicrobium sp. W1679 TaxID=3418770 RepID=UPI003CEE4446